MGWEHRTEQHLIAKRLRIAAFAPLAGIVVLAILNPPFASFLNEGLSHLIERENRVENLREWGGRYPFWAPLATSVLMLVQALAFPIPALVVTVVNSLLFGPFWGACLSVVSATAAAVVCFVIGQTFGEPIVLQFMSRRSIERSHRFMEDNGFLTILTSRLLPWVPFDVISFVAGISRMRVSEFALATLIGQIPAGFLYSYLGYEILSDSYPIEQVLLMAIGGVCAFVMIWVLVRRYRTYEY